jgi:hypothetical protein
MARLGSVAADQHDTTAMPSAVERDFATALGRLLDGRKARVPCRGLSRPVRSRFEELRADGILDRSFRAYRLSHIALYSSFRINDPADPSTDHRWDDPHAGIPLTPRTHSFRQHVCFRQ